MEEKLIVQLQLLLRHGYILLWHSDGYCVVGAWGRWQHANLDTTIQMAYNHEVLHRPRLELDV